MGGWEEEEREEAMIGFLKVETRHRHFSFDQMIARSGDRERQGEFLRRVTSSADRASQPRMGGSTNPLSSLLRLAPIHASRFALMLGPYIITHALSSTSATSTLDTFLAPVSGEDGRI